jgi:hypothetical protein
MTTIDACCGRGSFMPQRAGLNAIRLREVKRAA